MAFMALFGWIFLPLIPIALMLAALESVVAWVMTHIVLVNVIAAVLLALNLAILVLVLWIRARRKRAGVKKFRTLLLLAALWEGWVVLLFGLYLVVQPLRFIPEHFLQRPGVEDCFGEWTIVSYRGGYTAHREEELELYIGTRITYEKERFAVGSHVYPLKYEKDYAITSTYQYDVVWKSEAPKLFEGLDARITKMGQVRAYLQEDGGGRPVLGQCFYILDWDTLLIYYNGVYYRAERSEETSS